MVFEQGPDCSMAVITASCSALQSDECLLNRLEQGDRRALEELFGRYRQIGYRVAYRLLGNEPDALDAVQEGFVKALTHLGTFHRRSSFKTWLLRVVSNAALDLGRQRSRREMRSLDLSETSEKENHVPLTWENPGLNLERADVRRLIQQALDTLPVAQRQTFVLHAEAELSYREVADVLGISIGTVMSRLYYARQRLRTVLSRVLGSN